jgi:hypothetical protein
MIILVYISVLIVMTTAAQDVPSCSEDLYCIRGKCLQTSLNVSSCFCDHGWALSKSASQGCIYPQKSKLAAFLLSFFVGGFGADWYYLSVGNSGYIAAGVFKMLTLGGMGIWWLVDWIRILTNSFVDGQDFALHEWNP